MRDREKRENREGKRESDGAFFRDAPKPSVCYLPPVNPGRKRWVGPTDQIYDGVSVDDVLKYKRGRGHTALALVGR